MSNSVAFDYSVAFSRNLGWVTKDEQARLRNARVAIAGLGGGGGVHLLTLCRLGIARFNIADFDHLEVHNFNRQAGATLASVGQPKVDVLARMALDINLEADIELLKRVHQQNHLEYDDRLRPLLQLLAILEYRNGENWCDIHPVLRRLIE